MTPKPLLPPLLFKTGSHYLAQAGLNILTSVIQILGLQICAITPGYFYVIPNFISFFLGILNRIISSKIYQYISLFLVLGTGKSNI